MFPRRYLCLAHIESLKETELNLSKPPFILQVDGKWSSWSAWSDCSSPCRGGKTTRLRRCDAPAPEDGGAYCQGTNQFTNIVVYTRTCNDIDCSNTPQPRGLVQLAPLHWDQSTQLWRRVRNSFHEIITVNGRNGIAPCTRR